MKQKKNVKEEEANYKVKVLKISDGIKYREGKKTKERNWGAALEEGLPRSLGSRENPLTVSTINERNSCRFCILICHKVWGKESCRQREVER